MTATAPQLPSPPRISRKAAGVSLFLLAGIGSVQAKEWPEIKEVIHYRYRLMVKKVPDKQDVTFSWQTAPDQSSTVNWFAGAKGPSVGCTSYGELPAIIVMVRSPFMNGNLSTTPRLMYGNEIYDGRWLTDQDRKEGCPRLQFADDKPLMPMDGNYVIQAQEGAVLAMFSKWEKVWMGNRVVTRTIPNYTGHRELKLTVKELSAHDNLDEQTIQLVGPRTNRQTESSSTITEQVSEPIYESKFMDGKLNLKWDIQIQVSRRVQTFRRGAYRIDPDKGCGYYEYSLVSMPRYEDYVAEDELPPETPLTESPKTLTVAPSSENPAPVIATPATGDSVPAIATSPVTDAAPVAATPSVGDAGILTPPAAADTAPVIITPPIAVSGAP